MQMRIERDGSTTHLAPRGRLDVLSADDFKIACDMLLDQGVTRFVLDLSGLQYMDSTGMGALLSLVKRAETAGGVVRLHTIPPPIESIFELTRLNLVLSLHATRDEAVASLPAEV